MNESLQEIKYLVKAMDGDFTAQMFGYEMEGQAIVEDLKWLIEQAQKTERYENIIHAIANIDTIFYLPDGTDREWNDKEALDEIEKMVMPVWNEHCKKLKKETEQMFKNDGIKVNLD